jgi:hypothetical protein
MVAKYRPVGISPAKNDHFVAVHLDFGCFFELQKMRFQQGLWGISRMQKNSDFGLLEFTNNSWWSIDRAWGAANPKFNGDVSKFRTGTVMTNHAVWASKVQSPETS